MPKTTIVPNVLQGKPFVTVSSLPTTQTNCDFGPDSQVLVPSGLTLPTDGSLLSTTGGQLEADQYLVGVGGGTAILVNNQSLVITPSSGNYFVTSQQIGEGISSGVGISPYSLKVDGSGNLGTFNSSNEIVYITPVGSGVYNGGLTAGALNLSSYTLRPDSNGNLGIYNGSNEIAYVGLTGSGVFNGPLTVQSSASNLTSLTLISAGSSNIPLLITDNSSDPIIKLNATGTNFYVQNSNGTDVFGIDNAGNLYQFGGVFKRIANIATVGNGIFSEYASTLTTPVALASGVTTITTYQPIVNAQFFVPVNIESTGTKC